MNLKEIQELIRFVSRANVSEVEYETKDVKLVIKTSRSNGEPHIETQLAAAPPAQATLPSAPPALKPATAPAPSAAPAPVAPQNEVAPKGTVIKSPMIGTFYRSSSPDKPALVNVGDKVEKGKVICIIEAMKLFNEIEAEISGTIVKVLVNDASPVEFDQPLFLVEPN